MNELTNLKKEIASKLTKREQEVLNMRFGLDGSKTLTREETASHFKVSCSHIEQAEKSILRRLRSEL